MCYERIIYENNIINIVLISIKNKNKNIVFEKQIITIKGDEFLIPKSPTGVV
jgi:hypothetical protein